MDNLVTEQVRTGSLFLIRNAILRLPPLIVVDAIPNTDGLIPLRAAASDLKVQIPALPQPGPAGAQCRIMVFIESPPPGEYQAVAYQRFPTFPTGDINIEVPRRMVGNEGEYRLTYIVDDGDNVLRATASTPLRVHKTPPFGYEVITAPRPLLPANLTGPITDEYLANNDPVMFRIPEHPLTNAETGLRYVPYYGSTDSHMEVSYNLAPNIVVNLPDYPAVRYLPVPASVIRARGNGMRQLTYRLLDRAGNRARDSLILEIMVALRITPSNIAMPRVLQAIAPDNTVTLGDINQSGQGGVEVWLDSADGLQPGDTVTVINGSNTPLTTPLTYTGQPLPLRFIVTVAQIQAYLPGTANGNTQAALRFMVSSGLNTVFGPARNIFFNFWTLMQLAPPVLRNLSNGNLTCNSPLPASAAYANRFIEVFLPPSVLLRANTAAILTCVLSRQDDGSTLIAPPLTIPITLSPNASTVGQTVNVPYSTTMRIIGRGVMYFSYTTPNTAGQVLQSPPVAIAVRSVLPGNTYCDGAPFIPTP
ncbi:hypothetical protein B7453_04810 [Pseudomonas sp. IB20]|uniref:hypothetical protein n=1 Tax=Pseudomonas TaxID=286 RepID=UPI000BCB2C9B|nr:MULTISPECIES: hypothetical protein [unclassified Pseudomonas]MCV2229791.1 hypothetical protein [Pseudomonas sp. AU10]OZO05606.1 hypothetical protein B7453_04810 [Pseudomonas sp. IB20]